MVAFKTQSTDARLQFDTVSDLRGLPDAILDDPQFHNIELMGNATKGDGGGGVFYWDATSTASENGAGSGATKASGTIVKLTNTTTGRFLRTYGEYVDPKWFGAKSDWNGTTGTDNQAAIQAAINHGEAVCLADGDYKFSSQLTNSNMVPFFGPGRLFFDGSGEHAFIFGAADGAAHQYNNGFRSNIYIERVTQDWTDAYGGACLFNCESLHIDIYSRRFYYPVYMQGFNAGCTFNDVNILVAGDGVSQVLQHAAGTTGWVNQNTIKIHRAFTISSTSSALDVSGVEWKTDSSATQNGNVYINPSFELNNAGSGVTGCFKGSGATASVAIENRVVGGRMEATDFLLMGKGVTQNDFELVSTELAPSTADTILNADSTDDHLDLILNQFTLLTGRIGLDEPKKIFSLNKTNMVTQQPGGAELGCKPSRGCIYVAGATDSFVFHEAGLGLKHDSFTMSDTNTIVGFLLDLRNVNEDYTKCITLKAITNATGGRFAAVCYDDAFTILEGSDDCSLTFSSGEGLFRTGSDLTQGASEQEVSFGADVDYVIIGVVGGSASADVRSFEGFAYGRSDIGICYSTQAVTGIGVSTVNSISISPIIDTSEPMATQAPLTPSAGNSYASGYRATNATGSTASAAGWKFDGTAWRAEANLT